MFDDIMICEARATAIAIDAAGRVAHAARQLIAKCAKTHAGVEIQATELIGWLLVRELCAERTIDISIYAEIATA